MGQRRDVVGHLNDFVHRHAGRLLQLEEEQIGQ